MNKPQRSIRFALGQIVTRYRWLIVILWMIAGICALPFSPKASQVLQSGGFTSPDSESQRAINVLVKNLHLHPTMIQVIFTSQRYTVDNQQFIQQMQHALVNVYPWSEVTNVTTVIDNPRQISLDRHAAYANLQLNVDPDAAPKLLPELERRLQKEPDLASSIGGAPVFYADIQTVSEQDLRRAEVLAFPFAIIALLFVFRSVIAAILPALVGGCAVVISLALIYVLGQITTLSIFVLNITTLFGLGLGVDYSLFMLSRFREELANGHAIPESVAITVSTAGRAVVFSGLTVSIGLFGLTFMHINMLRSVGLGGILVVLLSLLAALTLLPAMLAILGHKINALPVCFPRLWLTKNKKEENDEEMGGFWYNLSNLVMRYPFRFLIPVLLILISFGLPFFWVRLSGPDASILPSNVPSRQAYDLLIQRFPEGETTPIVLAVQTKGDVLSKDNIENLYYYIQRIETDPRVKRVDSIVSLDPRFSLEQYELLYAHPQLINDPYARAFLRSTVAGQTMMVQVISKYGMSDPQSQALVQEIRNTNPGHGISVLVGGGTAGNMDYVSSLYADFPKAVLIVAGTTYLVLLLLFHSLILPLKAILMNTLSILASYGALVILFQQGFLHRALGFSPLGFVEASIPILLFCSLFGLSMDYEVFLLSRIQEEYWRTNDNTKAVAIGLQRSGGIITSAAVIVIVVTACFATADMVLVKALGIGMALAVVMDATLVRGLLVPATMRLLGKWNWWFPFSKRGE